MSKRQEFTNATKRLCKERADAICQRCGCRTDAGECNHALAAWLGGGRDLGNAEYLCRACHRDQTRKDQKAYAKVRRLRGKTRSQTAGTNRHRGRFGKRDVKWPSRPLGSKRWWKKLSGEVVER